MLPTPPPTHLDPPETRSQAGIYATLRKHLIDFRVPRSNVSLRQLCNDREPVYNVRGPDGVAVEFPFLTLTLDMATSGAYNGFREQGILEVQVLGKPASQLLLVSQIADLVDAAFLGYVQTADGLLFIRSRTMRRPLPMFGAPADRDVVGEQLYFALTAWPKYLLTHAANNGV